MKNIFKSGEVLFLLLIFSFLLSFPIGVIQALPPKPEPLKLVNDYEQLLTADEAAQLERKLSDFAALHQTGIAIIITTDLSGLTIDDFSARVGEEWGIGKAGSENGVVITVVPSGPKREVFIATGYGLEGAIPDAVAKRIVENEIIPNFRNGNYFEGLDAATTVIMDLAAGEYPASEYTDAEDVSPGVFLPPFLIMLLIFFIFSRGKRGYASPGKNIPFWTLFWLLGSGNRGNSGSFGRFSSGSGSGGGGGFSGFGGGSFGGGGAGGSW